MIYYALISWKTAYIIHSFTAYKKNSIANLLGGILMLVLVETVAVHFLLMRWSYTLTWILSLISLYTVIQIFGHIKAIYQRPNLINNDGIQLRNGLFGDTSIEYSNIENIQIQKITLNEKIKHQQLTLLTGLESHNIIIDTKEDITIVKAYGITKKTNKLLFYVDEPELFINTINNQIEKQC